MSQAMYTAASGMNNAQTAINVVSNNIANMNTTAFKESNITFSDVFYSTISSGSPAGKNNGGVNPKQVGYGSTVAAISQDFTTGTFQSTGKSSNMMIQGNGFFTVASPAGELFYTKAGDFQVDSKGQLVTNNGFVVTGTETVFGSTSSTTPIKIPQAIHVEVFANPDTATKAIEDLNAISGLTKGTFGVDLAYMDVAGYTHKTSVTVTLDGTEPNMSTIVRKFNDAVPAELTGKITASLVDGKFQIKADKSITDFKFSSGTSNFLSETELAHSFGEDGLYQSKVLDWQATIDPRVNDQTDLKASSYNFFETGAVEVTYSDGSKLTVEQQEGTNNLQFKYTTQNGIILTDGDAKVSADVATPGNMQIQMAHFLNPDGLTQEGSNLYGVGLNTGRALFGVADGRLFGSIQSGGVEASNVDLTQQFSDMIIAQRAIEANSRVFNTANSIMESLVYLGRS